MHSNRTSRARWAISATLLLASVACHDATGPDNPADGAALLAPMFSSLSLIELSPTQLRAGQPFELTVNTFGADGCWGRERTDVSVGRRGITVTPYNRALAVTNVGCTQALSRIPHRVTLLLATPGEHRLTVRGTDFESRKPLVVIITLTVLP
ncbi:MAG: hypothetical protein IPP90_11410 [Gemmatimonadaceae bacterium]|nr:hypothetical protein [Gemmatimonadaceae bacterium]